MLGIKHLTRGRTTLYDVKFEIGCGNGKRGKTHHFYEGNNKELAIKIANKVNKLIEIGGKTKALDWYDNEMLDWLEQQEEK